MLSSHERELAVWVQLKDGETAIELSEVINTQTMMVLPGREGGSPQA